MYLQGSMKGGGSKTSSNTGGKGVIKTGVGGGENEKKERFYNLGRNKSY